MNTTFQQTEPAPAELAAMQASEARFRSFVESAPDAVVFADARGRVQLVNAQTERLFGYRREELIGRPLERLMPKRFRREHAEQRQKYLAAPRAWPMGKRLDLFGRRRNGDEFPVEISLGPLSTSSGQWLCAVIRDATSRKQMEEALMESKRHYIDLFRQARAAHREMQRLSGLLNHAREKERAHISRELHDEVGSTLTAAAMLLKGLEWSADRDSAVSRDKLQKAQSLLQTAMTTVHDFARQLRPNVMDEHGLAPALRSLARTVAESTGLKVRLRSDPLAEKLDAESKLALFRIAQESLNNAVKHAGASQVRITVTKAPGGIVLRVADNGKSFPTAATGAGRQLRLGLPGMQERARLVSGAFAIRRRRGKGTAVRVVVPLKPTGG
jgi:PAS domain S-box-containing protein